MMNESLGLIKKKLCGNLLEECINEITPQISSEKFQGAILDDSPGKNHFFAVFLEKIISLWNPLKEALQETYGETPRAFPKESIYKSSGNPSGGILS